MSERKVIEVELLDGDKVRVKKVSHPLAEPAQSHHLEIEGGNEVIWHFLEVEDAADFRVELHGDTEIFDGGLRPGANKNEVSGRIVGSGQLKQGTSVRYSIFKRLDWEGGEEEGGGCVKTGGPPGTRPQGQSS